MTIPERKSVKVIIYNQQYSMLTDSDPTEVDELASAVDGLIRSIASKSGTGDLGRIAVLACLHLADQLRSAERELTEVEESSSQRHTELLKLLESI